jgi:hypothetical protein
MTAEPTDVRGSFRMLAERLVRESFPERTPDEVDDYVARAEARIRRTASRPDRFQMFGSIIVVAFDGYGARDLAWQERQRSFLRSAMSSALDYVGMNDVEQNDRGDGVVLVVPPPPERGVGGFVAYLAGELTREGRSRHDHDRLRVRVALHEGSLEWQEDGWTGSALVTALRLVDAEPLRQAMTAAPEAPLALIASDEFHQKVVRADYFEELAPSAFRPVDVASKELPTRAWIWLPGEAHPSPAAAVKFDRSLSDRPLFIGGSITGDRVGGGKVVHRPDGTRDGEVSEDHP